MKIAKFSNEIPATLFLWGANPVPSLMPSGEYARIAPRTWAVWLGNAPSKKYIYKIAKP